jgi:cytochrome c peroxidase
MHDGRFTTLEQVLDHYAGSVSATPNLDPLLTKSARPGIPLANEEKRNLVAFLKTLTDHSFLTNPRFSPQ